MNFLNSYILIFNRKLKAKTFSIWLLISIVIIYICAFILHSLDFQITNNDVIRKYQLKKINSKEFLHVNTVFIGDSSGGNAINSSYFDILSGLRSSNLTLTGSWGISGSYGILKNAYEKNPKIKNVIIIQTLDIWGRSFSQESLLELHNLDYILEEVNFSTVLKYYFNPKELIWHINYIFKPKSINVIDESNDYILQGNNKYSNGQLKINKDQTLNNIKVSSEKVKELRTLEEFCKKESLNCLFVNGPIHKQVFNNSDIFQDYINTKITSSFTDIKYFPYVFKYNAEKMGDSIDHMDVKYKNESTIDYYEFIKKDLVY